MRRRKFANPILLSSEHDSYYPTAICVLYDKNDRSIAIYNDWDAPGVASTFGWNIRSVQPHRSVRCPHSSTDGTVVCTECGTSAGSFIYSALEWIRTHNNAMAEDPGYFGND